LGFKIRRKESPPKQCKFVNKKKKKNWGSEKHEAGTVVGARERNVYRGDPETRSSSGIA
jgi:hypothetical protein